MKLYGTRLPVSQCHRVKYLVQAKKKKKTRKYGLVKTARETLKLITFNKVAAIFYMAENFLTMIRMADFFSFDYFFL